MKTYKITNQVNGMSYIGETSQNPNNRLAQHKYKSKTAFEPLYIGIREFGFENFTFEIIDNISEVDAIKQFNTLWPNGYNRETGGDARFTVHPETNRIHSERTKGRDNSYLHLPIICLDTGEQYPSLIDAAQVLDLDVSHICKVLKGKRKSTGGLRFSYLSEKVG